MKVYRLVVENDRKVVNQRRRNHDERMGWPVMLNAGGAVAISKFLSFVLRHRPDSIGIGLDSHGWTDVDTLLAQCRVHGHNITLQELNDVVTNNSKKRFAFSEDGQSIRASQGHSVEVDLGYRAKKPPEVLYHGTAAQFMSTINKKGLLKMKRHHVHLSQDADTARTVGSRHGKPVVLQIRAGDMDRKGFKFFLSDNGVWLVDAVPPEFFTQLS